MLGIIKFVDHMFVVAVFTSCPILFKRVIKSYSWC